MLLFRFSLRERFLLIDLLLFLNLRRMRRCIRESSLFRTFPGSRRQVLNLNAGMAYLFSLFRHIAYNRSQFFVNKKAWPTASQCSGKGQCQKASGKAKGWLDQSRAKASLSSFLDLGSSLISMSSDCAFSSWVRKCRKAPASRTAVKEWHTGY